MNLLSSLLPDSALLYLGSVAAASLLVTGTALIVVKYCRWAPLPLQHAVLTSALVTAIASPLLLALLAVNGVAFVELPANGVSRLELEILPSADQPQSPVTNLSKSTQVRDEKTLNFDRSRSASAALATQTMASAAAQPSAETAAVEWHWSDAGRLLVAVWGVGCIVSLAYLAVGLRRLRVLSGGCHEVTDRRVVELAERVSRSMRLAKAPKVYESSAARAPLTMGLWRSCVVVPKDVSTNLTHEQLRGLLCHEIGHIVRRDACVGMLQRVSLAMYWWNPFVRSVSTAIADVREQICDDLATRDVASGDSYASMLVELARQSIGARQMPATIGMFDGSRREFSRRVERLLDESRNVVTTLDWRMRIIAAALALALIALTGVTSIQIEAGAAELEPSTKAADVAAASADDKPPAVKWPKELWGVIHDEVGRPIAGAKVRLDVEKIHEYPIGRWDEVLWSREFTTGKDGVYRFDTTEFPEMKYRPFNLMMSVTADGYSDAKQWVWYSRRDTSVKQHWADVKLLAGRVVHGRVTDPRGQPVSGAIVKAASDYDTHDYARGWSWNPRATDKDGRFSISVPREMKSPVELWVVSPNWAPQRVVVPKRGDELADVRLQDGVRVSGTVSGEDDAPAAGIVVVAKSVDDGTLDMVTFPVMLAVKTDAEGRYRLPPLEGMYKIYLSQAEKTDDRLDGQFIVADVRPPIVTPASVALKGSREERVDFHAEPTLTVRGTLRWHDGKPVAKCQVRTSFMPADVGTGIWIDDTRTDEEGRYTVKLPKPIDGIGINVTGDYDAEGVWCYGMPVGDFKAEQKGLQSVRFGRLEKDLAGVDWVLKPEDQIPELHPASNDD